MSPETRNRRRKLRQTQGDTPTEILRAEKSPSGAAGEQAARIVVIQGATPGLQVLLDRPNTTIGRLRTNHLVLDSVTVSRRHAQVMGESNRYEIEDLNSQNGILINNERLKPKERRQLFHGDILRLGDHQLVFLNPSAFSDQEGISTITFDRDKICAEVDALLERLPALKRHR